MNERLILLTKKFRIKFRGLLKKSTIPTRSVMNPGVNNRIPETTMKKPSPKVFRRFSGSFKAILLMRFTVLIPSLLIKILPIIAVKTISSIVSREPMYSLILRNKYISRIGIDKKRIKKIKFVLTYNSTLKTIIELP